MGSPMFQLNYGVRLTALDASTTNETYLAALPNGTHLQLSANLYHLLRCLDTPRSLTALAETFYAQTGMKLNQDVVTHVVTQLLEPRGLITQCSDLAQSRAAASTPGHNGKGTAPSLLALHVQRRLLPAHVVAPVTHVLRVLYHPVLVMVFLVLGVLAHGLTYMHLGVPPVFNVQSISVPFVYSVFVLSVLLHELGHMTACRRWQCPHGALGVGLYFFSPVFFVDVTSAWRLPRWQRVVVDIGGVYFQLIFTTLLAAAFWVTGNTGWLWSIVLIDLSCLINLNPLVKFDGYWLLSDVLGVPNLHKRSAEVLRFSTSWLLWRLHRRGVQPMVSAWGRLHAGTFVALLGYTIVSFNLWMLMLALMIPLVTHAIRDYPSFWATALQGLETALPALDVVGMVAALANLFLPTLLLVNLVVLLSRLSKFLYHRIIRI